MRRWLTLFFGLAVACSYSLDLPVCKVTCQSQADCPADSTCRSGFCQKGSVDQCAVSTGGSSPDAASTGGVTGTGGTTGTGGMATGGSPATGGAPGTGGVATGGTPGTGGAPATGGAPGTGGMMMPPPPPDASTSTGCNAGCGGGTICCMAPWGCMGTCVPDCRPTGTCQQTDVCNMVTGLCQPDCRRTGGNCPPGSGLVCNTTTGVCR